ncbi:MAG: diaminopimelate epimerase [Cyclobacteriaceae bacterium]
MATKIIFNKYQGTGNDFVMIDDRDLTFPIENLPLIQQMCNRRFGIGADGLIIIRPHLQGEFEMLYFNSDGSQSLCGNGSRCAVRFAHDIGVFQGSSVHFQTYVGLLTAKLDAEVVQLAMPDVSEIDGSDNDIFVNTGSPHHVRIVDDVDTYDVVGEGRIIRHSSRYAPTGTNVNFVQILDSDNIYVRTYERGVEEETLSCGTGVTASAIVVGQKLGKNVVDIKTRGGELQVGFSTKENGGFTNVYLKGPAEKVFDGVWNDG